MTRDEFQHALMSAPFTNDRLRNHDAAQRALIEQQAKEIADLTRAHGNRLAEMAKQAQTITRLRESLGIWQSLYRRAINVANGLTNYVEERPGLHDAERQLNTLEMQAQRALEEEALK